MGEEGTGRKVHHASTYSPAGSPDAWVAGGVEAWLEGDSQVGGGRGDACGGVGTLCPIYRVGGNPHGMALILLHLQGEKKATLSSTILKPALINDHVQSNQCC